MKKILLLAGKRVKGLVAKRKKTEKSLDTRGGYLKGSGDRTSKGRPKNRTRGGDLEKT